MNETDSPPVDPPPPPPSPPGPHWFRALRRSQSERMVAGVAGGIAHTYGVDVSLVRIAFVLTTFFGGLGVILYGVAWLIVPESDDTESVVERRDFRNNATQILAFVLLGIGALMVFGRIFPDDGPGVFTFFWPLALIAGGIAILVVRVHDDNHEEVAPPVVTPPADSTTESAMTVDASVSAAAATDAITEEQPAAAATTTSAWTQATPWPVAPTPRKPRRSRRRHRPFLGPLVVSLLLVFAGVTALLDALDVVDTHPQVVLSIAMVVTGVGLVVSAWFGRARGLVLLALLMTPPLVALSIVDVPFEGGVGEETYRPATVSEVRDEYRLGAGQLLVDLRDVPLTASTELEIEASVAFGELIVYVPADARVEAEAKAGAGNIQLFGLQQEAGIDAESDRIAPGTEGSGSIRLEVEVGMGAIRVERYDDADLQVRMDVIR